MRWCSIFAIALVVSASAAMSAAQTSNPPTEDSPGQNSTSPHNPTPVDLLKAQTDLVNAQKGLLDAEQARQTSEQSLRNARIGTVVGQSEIKGTVTMGENSGRAEALLMATAATIAAAQRVGTDLSPTLQSLLTADGAHDRQVLVLTNRSELAVPDAVVFDMKIALLSQAFVTAQERFAAAVAQDPHLAVGRTQAFAPLAVADAIIGNVARLGSYFNNNYTFGAVDADLPPEVLPAAIIQGLEGARAGAGQEPNFVIPSYSLRLDPNQALGQVRQLQAAYLQAAADRAQAKRRSTELHEQASSAPQQAKPAAERYDDATELLTTAMTRFDEFVTSLQAGADGAEPLIVRIVRQQQIQDLLRQRPNPLALLVTNRPVGGYYTRTSLWTFLGGPPLYTMGGSATTYSLFDPVTGRVYRSGAVPIHAGYRSVRQVERLFATPPRPPR